MFNFVHGASVVSFFKGQGIFLFSGIAAKRMSFVVFFFGGWQNNNACHATKPPEKGDCTERCIPESG